MLNTSYINRSASSRKVKSRNGHNYAEAGIHRL
jgi:hypothetical protein